MVKKLQEILSGVDSLILDTSFILPYVGIKVKEVDSEIFTQFKSVKLYYPYALIPELIGVIFKVSMRMGLEKIPNNALIRFNTIIYGGDIRLITPKSEDIEMAYNLVKKGLKDLFDALLYSTSIRTDIKIITGDRRLVEFLRENGLETRNIIMI